MGEYWTQSFGQYAPIAAGAVIVFLIALVVILRAIIKTNKKVKELQEQNRQSKCKDCTCFGICDNYKYYDND